MATKNRCIVESSKGILLSMLVNAGSAGAVTSAVEMATAQQPLCSTQLSTAIAQVLETVPAPKLPAGRSLRPDSSPKLRSRWGILVQTLGEPGRPVQTLYAQDAERFFIPASNAKLLTTAAALYKLTPSFQISTSVYLAQSSNDSVNIRVLGQGDPSITDQELTQLAQQLRQQGIQRIQELRGEDTYFQGPVPFPQWEWGDLQAGYAAPVNSLIVNQNAIAFQLVPQALGQPLRVQWDDPAETRRWRIENRSLTVAPDADEFVEVGRAIDQPVLQVAGHLRVGSAPEPVGVAVFNPGQNFLQRFQKALAAQKIPVARTLLLTTPETTEQQRLATIQSPPLSALLVETNQESNNLYAEAILRSLGAQAERWLTPEALAKLETTSDRGLAVVKAALTELGVDPTSYVLADGSGLSRHNLISPEALVQTLQAMANRPESAAYQASLAVAGVNGTLRDRWQNTAVQGNLWGKTGTLSGVVALSGYLKPAAYSPLVFSLIVNQSDQPASRLRQQIDEIVLTLARLQSCPTGG